VDTVFDIGANIGQSAQGFRKIGYRHKVVSFEPVSHLYARVRANAAADPLWDVENVALGTEEGRQVIHVSGGHAGASDTPPPRPKLVQIGSP
jgi:FkbM family methyltransferase